MKYWSKLLVGMVMILSGVGGLAQNLSNRGKEFWVGYGHHQFMEWSITNPGNSQANSQEMVIYLSAEQTANVTVSVYGTAWVKNYAVPAGTVIATDLIPKTAPYDARFFTVPPSFGGTGGEGIFSNKAIHIESDVPIVAYAHIYGSFSSGATMLMPVETWGYAYTSVNSKQDYNGANYDCYSWMYVIAQEDNTVVEITPSVTTRMGKPAGVPFTATLMKGEAYQVIGATISSKTGYELTGTRVKSIANASGKCYPVAVFSGSSRTANPASCGSGGGDNDNQQLFPSQAWGKRYLTAPTSNSTTPANFMRNTFKVVAKDPNTVVKLNGTTVATLQPGQVHSFESNQPNYIEADKPIMVGQFMTGGSCVGSPGTLGDPEMFFISPLEQGIRRIGFYRNNREAIQVNYLTLIIPDSGVNSLKIDGVLGNYNARIPHPQLPGYSIVVKRWSAAQAQAWAESDSAFTAVTYGLGDAESYAYNAGTLINNLNILGSIHNELDSTALEHAYTCTNTPVQLGVRVSHQPTKMVWQLNKLGSAISPNNDVTLYNPVATDTILFKGISYYRYQLPQSYLFSDSGDYEVTIISTNPNSEKCDKTEEVKFQVRVRNKPKVAFSFAHTGCVTDTVYLSGPAGAENGYGISKWKWTFPDGNTSGLQNTKTVLPATGVNNIKLTVISTEGCVADTVQPVTATPRPSAGFTLAPASVCEGGSMSFTDNSSPGGATPLNAWVWDFGNGKTLNAGDASSQTATYPAYGTYPVKLVVKTSPTCVSDTVSKPVSVYAKPKPGFTYPAGCLPTDGVVQFHSATTTPDAQAIASYSWNFGDASATAANPNTSVLQDPTHTYAYGTYDINYSVTTANGCTKDTVVKASFNIKPVLSYAALPPVCENAATVSVATAAVTNGVGGAGIYRGPGTDNTGRFNPSLAGAGTHTIWYVFTSTGGCKDSVSQTILVQARPGPSFTVTPNGCLPASGQVQFTNTSFISDGQSMSYNWNFGDAGAGASNPNTSTAFNPTHNFSEGAFAIKLTATTPNGCTSDTILTKTFSVTPQLLFPVLASVCESQPGTISLATASVMNGVKGTGVYRGPGTNTLGNFNPTLAGAGTHTIWYDFTSAGGCAASVSQTIKVHPKPMSRFTVNSDICLDGTATLTDQSSLLSGNIIRWNWNLGDGSPVVSNTSNTPFTKSYAASKTYTVKLVAISDSSCSSDTAVQTISVHPLPVADFDLPAGVCLPGGSAPFKNTSTLAENSTLSYQWNFGDGSAVATAPSPSHIYAVRGSYTINLRATSANGCSNSISKVLSAFYDKPVALFNVAPDTLCQGTDNVFTDLSTAPNSTVQQWNWNFADGTSSTSRNPVKRYTTAGNYNVNLQVSNTVGCTSDPFTQKVIVYVQPVIDAGPSFVVLQGTPVQFNPKVNDSTSVAFLWTPGYGLTNPTLLRPTVVANYEQTYTLKATGLGNCTATDFLTVNILKEVKVPNAFSPNGDGVNDTWEIPNLADYQGATVEVFNRYGQRVYYSEGYPRPWEGRLNGQPLPVATYYYVINLKNGFQPLTGSVTIVR